MRLSCSIVSYGHPPEMLRRAVESIKNSLPDALITLVDNLGSHRLEEVSKTWGITYVNPGHNLGFGRAHNLVLHQYLGQADYHLVLNPDVEFGAEVLPQLLEAYPKLENCGLLTPLIRYPDGRVQHLCKLVPTPLDLLGRRFLPGIAGKIWKQRFENYEMRGLDYFQTLQVPVLSGCFYLLSDHVLRHTGGFDERFFLYMEDVDLSRRSAEKYNNYHFPEVEIIHHYQKGSYRSWKPFYLHIRSAVKYFNKWGWLRDPLRAELNRRASERNKGKSLPLINHR